ncbi:hypothetical protein HYC85_015726 [Camellia sinensis]|uniref:SPX domain-containing protein n=1 Tax=Camellia sinensis TaxID=4442 RepID=A0A7J7H1G3_CAMSI|nr:hypothetical protein HYC85_015726 [Camellia sinensis]
MKFGKEFTSQMVPEWQEAYMNYNHLKTHLKEIQRVKLRHKPPPPPPTGLKRKLTLYRAFSGLTQRIASPRSPSTSSDIENQAIVVQWSDGGDQYETMFLRAAEEGGEHELVYFRRLDEEFNKVVKFYKLKVEEVMKEANMLNKQMDALIAFRIKVEGPRSERWPESEGSVEIRRAATEVIEEEESSSHGHSNESGDDKFSNENRSINQNAKQHKPKNSKAHPRTAPLEILNQVKMNNTLETPRSTIKGLLSVHNPKEIKFSRENLKKVEEQLKRAFIEFYQKLRLLKSYSFLNMLAFSKIMKKYDKITSRNASKAYLKMVDNFYLGSSDEVNKLMDRVEATFIKHFSNSNRSKGMNILRPKVKRERHRITFSLGFLVGCSMALLIALILAIHTRNIISKQGHEQYMVTLFPLYSLFGFITLHMLMYAGNIYYWRQYRINYSFMFGFKEGTELGYREVLLLSFGVALLALASVHANLDMEIDPKTQDYKAITELVPMGLLVFLIVILFCPFNIIYRSSRFFLLACAFHCLCAPLYKVTLPDFFLADQLTSQVQAFRSLEFYVCYYFWGDYKLRQNTCMDSGVYNTFYFIVATIPFVSRLLQCLRRFYEEKDGMQGLNGLKYFITIVALCMRTAYSLNKGLSWNILAWIASAIATVFSTYWDLVFDWGLLQKKSKNRWLRDKLLVPQKSVYFAAMVLNVLLRFVWLQTVLDYQVSFLHKQTLAAIVPVLEIIRRGIWNFFRMENEHLNNVGKYRAFKSAPLPFNYDEDDDKIE